MPALRCVVFGGAFRAALASLVPVPSPTHEVWVLNDAQEPAVVPSTYRAPRSLKRRSRERTPLVPGHAEAGPRPGGGAAAPRGEAGGARPARIPCFRAPASARPAGTVEPRSRGGGTSDGATFPETGDGCAARLLHRGAPPARARAARAPWPGDGGGVKVGTGEVMMAAAKPPATLLNWFS